MKNGGFGWLRLGLSVSVVGTALAIAAFASGGSAPVAAGGSAGGDSPAYLPASHPLALDEGNAEELLQRDNAFMSRRTAGDIQLDGHRAGWLRAEGAKEGRRLHRDRVTPDPATFTGAWRGIGPNPIVQITRSDAGSFAAMSGRIGALAIRPSNGQFILGAAQGGIWLYDATEGVWVPKTDNLPSLAIGALAVAPSNDAIVYAGTGEGALSGDSYFGNGIIKSTDGGEHWANVSGDYFEGVAISNLVVDPANARHLYVSVLRGRGGARRTSQALHSRFGIWESTDGGVNWKLLKEAKSESNGATDVELDPQNTRILYASFWGDAMYKSTDGGRHWSPIMNGLPAGADYAAAQTRFAMSLSHPTGGPAVLYSGFDYVDAGGAHPSRVWKSTDQGASWQQLPAGTGDDTVEDYCGGQCFYDNVIEADPTNPDVVFAAGQFNYGIGSGGIFRSDDGGQTWKNLGYDQHPDFHALAFDRSNTAHVLVGSDGGVWYSDSRGGRPNAGDPLSAVTWQNLNGTVNPATSAVTHRTNLAITQFTSIANVPTIPAGTDSERFWGGTQDNGTLRKSTASQTWADVASGDGGQVLVDPTNANFVYGTYFGITPYRYTNGGGVFFSNQYIRGGINLSDRSDFYIPWTMNQLNTSQLFLGTYKLYRTDNAKAPSAGSVRWNTISPDLTGGCTGTAPNGARTCAISAIGVGGGTAVYVGTLDGFVQFSPDAQTSSTPTWVRLDQRGRELPNRPVSQIAVDRSNYRVAYLAYNGFNAATPRRPGHVFKTTDGGDDWTDISGDLPDVPVNSIILDPSYPNTLYIGTDVGAFVTSNGGGHWAQLGAGLPPMAVWQLDLDPAHRLLAAGTHGRGAWSIKDASTVPALVLSKVDAGKPVGPSSHVDYTVTLRNIGNAAATGVTITDPVPDNTSFVSAADGGTYANGVVTWSGLSVPAGGSIDVHFTVSISDALKSKVASIVNDGFKATSAQGMSATGSPHVTPIAPPFAVALTPATQTDGGRVGTTVSYHVTLENDGFQNDTYALSAASTYPTHFLDATCTLPASSVSVPSGGTSDFCVTVDIPAAAPNDEVNTATVTATSTGSSTVAASGTIKTIAVAVDTLLVDNDDNGPDVQGIYKTALTTATVPFSTWDLKVDANLPLNYLKAFKNVVWFAGNSYPGPITPYEARLASFLDGGGRLLMSGQDILDQAAGTTAFVHDYLHITWDGSEAQNDKPTTQVHGVTGNPVSNGIVTVPLDHTVLRAAFEDRITPNGTAATAFTDDSGAANALSYSGTYKVVFLAFPLESYGSAAQKADLVTRAMTFFGP